MFKAIVSDFDGTLAGKDWKISASVVKKINQWLKKGKHFSISTGKQYKHIQHECRRLDLADPQIVRGGAEIVEPQSGKIIRSEYFEPVELEILINVLLKSGIPFSGEQGNLFYTIDGKPLAEVPDVVYKKISEMPFDNIAKIVLWTDDLMEGNVEKLVKSQINGRFNSVEVVKSYSPFSKNWQITSKKATKYTAVLELASLLDIKSSEIVGVGDSYNDYSLLSACGYKVAMKNAPKELTDIADYIAPSYEDDGVAVLIDKLLE